MVLLVLKFLAGVILFLFGFYFIEESIKLLVGRKVKLFLRKQTASPFKSILGGTIVTALLQSSSIVNFLVLSFVSAGIIDLASALFVIMGTNFGTTLDSWIIALFGFKVNLEKYSLPLLIIGGYLTLFAKEKSKYSNYGKLVLGLGFLFFGLEYIKIAVSSSVQNFDFNLFASWHWSIYVLVGLVITAITQSSSVTMAILLSALYSSIIDLYSGMAMILGSELGTTIKMVMAAYRGPAIKKQVAYGNLLFNLLLILINLPLLPAWHIVLTQLFNIKDSLIALVLFQGLINLVTIILFAPWIRWIARILNKYFDTQGEGTVSIHKVNPTDGEYAFQSLKQEVDAYLQLLLLFFTRSFDGESNTSYTSLPKSVLSKTDDELYNYLKYLHTEIRSFALELSRQNFSVDQKEDLILILEMGSEALYSIKSMKDAWTDISNFKNSSKPIKYAVYERNKLSIHNLVTDLHAIYFLDKLNDTNKVQKVEDKIESDFKDIIQKFYDPIVHDQITEEEYATILNCEREIYMAKKYLCVVFRLAVSVI